jgi:hypothetical protein
MINDGLRPLGKRKDGVPSCEEMHKLLLARSEELQVRGYRENPLIFDDEYDIDPELFKEVVNGFTTNPDAP